MACSSLENILSSAQPIHRKEIEEILKNRNVTIREYSHRLFVCGECYRLVDRLHVMLVYDPNQVYETVFYCRKCGSRMRLLSGLDELVDIPCSGCGRKPLQATEEFLWD